MNKAFFTGNLARDPETRMMTNGKARCTFTLAVSRAYTSASGEREADFIMFTAFDKTAELAQRYLAKGRKLLVESRVKTGSYEKDGKRVYTTEFIVDKLEFLSPGNSSQSANTDDTDNAQGEQQQAQSAYSGGFVQVDDDDLPF